MTKILYTETTLVRSRTITVEAEGPDAADPVIETRAQVVPREGVRSVVAPPKVIPFAAGLRRMG